MENDAKLEQYMLLAKGLRGLALCDLIHKATAEPGLFMFGELLCLPAVQELGAGEHRGMLSLLQLFAYGTWADYAANPGLYPQLTEAQQDKLKLLTVASLASGRRSIAYAELQAALGLGSVRHVEDVLIAGCIYGGLLRGRLDQRQGCVHVEGALARDVAPERLPEVAAALREWLAASQAVLAGIEERVAWAAGAASAAERQRGAREAAAEAEACSVRAALELQAQHDVGAMALDDSDTYADPPAGGGAGQEGAARGGGAARVSKRRR